MLEDQGVLRLHMTLNTLEKKYLKHSNQSKGLFGKRDFIYKPETDKYESPAGQQARYRFTGYWCGKR